MKKTASLNYIFLSFRTAPLCTCLKILLLLWTGFYPGVMVLASGHLIDTGVKTIAKEASFQDILAACLLLTCAMALDYVMKSTGKLIEIRYEAILTEKINLRIAEKKASVKYCKIEEKETQELFQRISDNPAKHIQDGFNNLMSLSAYVIEVVSIVGIIFTYSGWIPLAILAVSVPALYISLKCGAYDYSVFDSMSEKYRRANYYKSMLTSRDNVEEREIFGYTDTVNKWWNREQDEIVKLSYWANFKTIFMLKISGLLSIGLLAVIMLFLLIPLRQGLLSVGIYITLIKAQNDLVQKITWNLTEQIKTFESNRNYIKDFVKLLHLEEDADALCPRNHAAVQKIHTLRFEQVSFKYPGTDRYILRDFNLTLTAGKKYAFVGENGAGKTTVTKLLLGMYNTYEGNIFFDELNIRDLSIGELKSYLTVLYQNFFRYEISIKDNLYLGNMEKYNETEMNHVLEQVGLREKVASLSAGADTMLGKLHETGQDLSGGQWQKLAIARCMLCDAPLVILDEPTAAMDPLSEKSVYDSLGAFPNDKLVIMITHRLGLAVLADEIIVLQDGGVCEKGSHDELMREGKVYYHMYEAQRSWYADEK